MKKFILLICILSLTTSICYAERINAYDSWGNRTGSAQSDYPVKIIQRMIVGETVPEVLDRITAGIIIQHTIDGETEPAA